jgi:hypothetical protein
MTPFLCPSSLHFLPPSFLVLYGPSGSGGRGFGLSQSMTPHPPSPGRGAAAEGAVPVDSKPRAKRPPGIGGTGGSGYLSCPGKRSNPPSIAWGHRGALISAAVLCMQRVRVCLDPGVYPGPVPGTHVTGASSTGLGHSPRSATFLNKMGSRLAPARDERARVVLRICRCSSMLFAFVPALWSRTYIYIYIYQINM